MAKPENLFKNAYLHEIWQSEKWGIVEEENEKTYSWWYDEENNDTFAWWYNKDNNSSWWYNK